MSQRIGASSVLSSGGPPIPGKSYTGKSSAACGNDARDKERYINLPPKLITSFPSDWFSSPTGTNGDQVSAESLLKSSLQEALIGKDGKRIPDASTFNTELLKVLRKIKMPQHFEVLNGNSPRHISPNLLGISSRLFGDVSGASHPDIVVGITSGDNVTTVVGCIELKWGASTIFQLLNYIVSLELPSRVGSFGFLKPSISLLLTPTKSCFACRLSVPEFWSNKPYKLEQYEFSFFDEGTTNISGEAVKLILNFLCYSASHENQGNQCILKVLEENADQTIEVCALSANTLSIEGVCDSSPCSYDSLFGRNIPHPLFRSSVFPGLKGRLPTTSDFHLTHGALLFCDGKKLKEFEGLVGKSFAPLVVNEEPLEDYVIKVITNFYGIHLNNLTPFHTSLVTFLKMLCDDYYLDLSAAMSNSYLTKAASSLLNNKTMQNLGKIVPKHKLETIFSFENFVGLTLIFNEVGQEVGVEFNSLEVLEKKAVRIFLARKYCCELIKRELKRYRLALLSVIRKVLWMVYTPTDILEKNNGDKWFIVMRDVSLKSEEVTKNVRLHRDCFLYMRSCRFYG
eukprot:GHVR01123729.1.p1 GENE.GHVR01123729.1~~GHVR01123729.1.p1  ORF type:complete len:593 (+),score=3.44 GHVR01123729.1:75-1781(+)